MTLTGLLLLKVVWCLSSWAKLQDATELDGQASDKPRSPLFAAYQPNLLNSDIRVKLDSHWITWISHQKILALLLSISGYQDKNTCYPA